MVKQDTIIQPHTITTGPPTADTAEQVSESSREPGRQGQDAQQPPMVMESEESTATAVKQNAKLMRPLNPE